IGYIRDGTNLLEAAGIESTETVRVDHMDLLGEGSHRDEVGVAVVVHIRCGTAGVMVGADRVIGRGEAARPVSEKNAEFRVVPMGDDQVFVPIAIHVAVHDTFHGARNARDSTGRTVSASVTHLKNDI